MPRRVTPSAATAAPLIPEHPTLAQLRLHQTPTAQEITACRPWLDREITLLRPRVIICLGSTAVQAFLGKHFRVTRQRGEFIESPLAPLVMATLHPAAILRIPDAAARTTAHRQFIADLRKVAGWLIPSEQESFVRKTSQGL